MWDLPCHNINSIAVYFCSNSEVNITHTQNKYKTLFSLTTLFNLRWISKLHTRQCYVACMSVGFILLVQLSALYCLYKCRRYIASISVGLILSCRANDPQNIFHNHQHIFYQWLKLLIGVTVILTSRGVLCILKNCKEQSTYNQSLSPRAIILFTQLVPTLFCKIKLKKTFFHK